MRVMVLVLWCLVSASPALAGAWLRKTGETFLSTGADISIRTDAVTRRDAARLYVEHGLHPHLTLGADLFATAQGAQMDGGHGIVFLRSSIFRAQSRVALSVSAGMGLRASLTGTHTLHRIGIAAGVPFRKTHHSGWASAEAIFEHQTGKPGLTRKIDATFGLTFSPQWQGVVDLSLQRDGSGYNGMEIAPRAVFRANASTRLVFGLKAARAGTTRTRALSFDIWRSF